MKIRMMQESDIPTIVNITRVAWGEMTLHKLMEDRHGLIGDKLWSERKAEEVKSFCEKNPSQMIVAVVDNNVVGYAAFRINKEDKIGNVGNNAVDPAYQGKGVGTAMNKWIIDFFREEGLSIARVETMVHDIAAQKVYEKHGFKELARTIHYSMDL